jgi:tetratricopeptide (TPR) repeat protein
MGDQALQTRKSFLEEAETFLEKGDDRAALALAESRLERTPGDPDARIVICRVRIQQGRLDEAGEMLHEVEDLLASLSRVYMDMGDLFLKKEMPDAAKTYYRKFISLNPDTPEALEITERLKDISEPRETDDGAGTEEEETVRVPEDFQTVTLAELYIRQGHLRMAKEVLEVILRKKDPQQERAAERLREVTERLSGEEAAAKAAPVVAELSRWLDNIGRLRNDAA